MRSRILGIPVDRISESELRETLDGFFRSRGNHVVTLNPEILMEATANNNLQHAITQASLILPDGVGIQLAARFLKRPRGIRLTGVDLVHDLARRSAEQGRKLYLLGARPGVAVAAAQALQRSYPGLKIVGAESGSRFWGTRVSDTRLCEMIRSAKPDVLLVAFGSPKQELWLTRHLHELPSVRVGVGVGGTFDFLAGRVRRAPAWLRRIGLEWFWRLLVQPWRFQRILTAVVRFPIAVLRYRTDGQE